MLNPKRSRTWRRQPERVQNKRRMSEKNGS
jgi:hypothetical protein